MQQINEDIKSGRFKQMYLLYGKEAYALRKHKISRGGGLCQILRQLFPARLKQAGIFKYDRDGWRDNAGGRVPETLICIVK